MPNATADASGVPPEFHTHALPKDTFDYLCTIFPGGWILLYTYPLSRKVENGEEVKPEENYSGEGMVISTAIKPNSILVPVAKHLHTITSM